MTQATTPQQTSVPAGAAGHSAALGAVPPGSPPSAEQMRVAEGLREHAGPLQVAIRLYVRQLGLSWSPERAEDLLSEVSFKALLNAERYDPSCSLPAWLKKIALNCVREHRKRESHAVPVADAPAVAAASQALEGLSGLSEAEMFDLLQEPHEGRPADARMARPTLEDLLPLIPKAHHEVLELRVNHGLRGAALAARLRTSEGAAATRLSRARERLAAAYNRWMER